MGDALGLRLKVIAVVAIAVGIVQAFVGLSQVREEESRLRQEVARRGHQIQRALAVPSSVALANREIEELDAVLWRFSEDVGRDLDILSVAVLDLGGRVLAHTDPTVFGKRVSDPFYRAAVDSNATVERESVVGGQSVLQLSMPIEVGRRWGTMTMQMSLEPMEARLRELQARVLTNAMGVTLLMALVLYLLISRTVLKPLMILAETAQRVANGQLDARVPKRSGHDQMTVLGDAFNEMTRTLQSYTAELEEKVDSRTRELKAANDALGKVNEELGDAVEKLGHLARTDALTGLFNRRAFTEALDVELRRTERHERPFSLLMIDVDYFKKYNDSFGHPDGDRLLIALGETFRENLRAMDVVARYGGEEFAVILGETHTEDAVRVADKLRMAVREKVFREAGDGKPAARVTVSIGVATYPQDASSGTGLISQADQALYLAKEAGRDLVVACSNASEGGEE